MQHVALLLSLLLTTTAQAESLAILPLDKGPSAPDYNGLGYVLSGMLTTDLSHVAALQLVERQRLDELLKEVELGTSTFIDPATAAEMGKGVGAQWVLVGSWTVIKDDLALNARVVSVEGGSILGAADAVGPVSDYLTVEKDLVERLLAELPLTVSSGERRKLIAEAPTENFAALRQYSDGVAAKRKGEVEAAQKAFQAALAADPAYADAQAAIDGLRALVESERARRASAEETEEQRLQRTVLEATVDERTRPASFQHNSHTQAELGLRIAVLWDQGRHCQRWEELWAYADHVNWTFSDAPPPKGSKVKTHSNGFRIDDAEHMIKRAVELGYVTDPEGHWSHDRMGLTGFLGDLQSADRFVFDHATNRMLMGSIERCLSPTATLERLQVVHGKLEKTDQLADSISNEATDLTLEDRFLAQEIEAEIWVTGSLSAARVAELEALLARVDGVSRRYVESWMTQLARYAETTARLKPARTSVPVEVLETRLAGLIARDPAVLDDSSPLCARWSAPDNKYTGPAALERTQRNYERSARDLDRWPRRWAVVELDMALLTPTLMGCVKGVEGALAEPVAARAWHAEQAKRLAPGAESNERCEGVMSGVNAWFNEFQWQQEQWLRSIPSSIDAVSAAWTSGCLVPPADKLTNGL